MAKRIMELKLKGLCSRVLIKDKDTDPRMYMGYNKYTFFRQGSRAL